MKKFTLTILFIIQATLTIAQEKIDTYYSSWLGRDFNIRAINGNNDKPILYLEVFNGILHDRYYFKIDNELISFIAALSQAKSKFLDWKQVVNDNDVSYTTKPMDIVFPSVVVCWYDSFEKKFTFLERLNLKPIFNVTNNGECRFQLSALSDLSNGQAYSVILSNAKEFNKLISKISSETLLSKLAKSKKDKKTE